MEVGVTEFMGELGKEPSLTLIVCSYFYSSYIKCMYSLVARKQQSEHMHSSGKGRLH